MNLKKSIGLVLLVVTASLFCAPASFAQGKRDLNIVFIGNSITYGAGLSDPATEAPPVITAAYLKQQSNVGNLL